MVSTEVSIRAERSQGHVAVTVPGAPPPGTTCQAMDQGLAHLSGAIRKGLSLALLRVTIRTQPVSLGRLRGREEAERHVTPFLALENDFWGDETNEKDTETQIVVVKYGMMHEKQSLYFS